MVRAGDGVGGGVGSAVGSDVGAGVGGGVSMAVGEGDGVGRAVGDGVGAVVAVDCGVASTVGAAVGSTLAEIGAVEASADDDGLATSVGSGEASPSFEKIPSSRPPWPRRMAYAKISANTAMMIAIHHLLTESSI
jgi:hypothetical protein